jgi:hypothetical protein
MNGWIVQLAYNFSLECSKDHDLDFRCESTKVSSNKLQFLLHLGRNLLKLPRDMLDS